MKKTALFPLLSAFAALSFVGCDTGMDGPTEWTAYPVFKITEGNTVTEYEYNEKGQVSGEKKTEGSKVIYEMDNYEYASDQISFSAERTVYNEDGTTTLQNVETDYVSPYIPLESEYKVFEGNELVERRLTKYDNDYNISEFTHTKDGVELIRRSAYDYTQMQTSSPYITYKESKNGGEVLDMAQYSTRIETNMQTGMKTIIEWEIYAGWKSSNEKGILIESVADFESDGLTDSYTITRYDAEGKNPVKIEVEREYKMITGTY
jgi:YD repeat-containing protein